MDGRGGGGNGGVQEMPTIFPELNSMSFEKQRHTLLIFFFKYKFGRFHMIHYISQDG